MPLFEGLSDKLQKILSKIKSSGRITDSDVKLMSREIKMALLEADVNYKVVKDFIKVISTKALGKDVLESLTPGQQVVKIVSEELKILLGEKAKPLKFSALPGVVLFCGLQGSGKTTSAGKLAKLLKKQGKKPLLVACDIYRPAAIEQLKIVSEQAEVGFFEMGKKKPVDIAKASIEYANENLFDTVIIDTAGRLHIDETLMKEINDIKKAVKPEEILLVVDSMTGQDAVNVATEFNNILDITGIVLTKLDGDTRGGAALSITSVTGKPIKFTGVGEKMDEFEVFHPDRMASRILGMGDVLTLIEKAQESFDSKKASELENKIKTQSFTLEDYMDQIDQMKSMGSIENVLGMMPGMNKKALKNVNVDDKKFQKSKAIIQSMTKKERYQPSIIDGSRKKRIALGSGNSVQEINKLLKEFEQLKKMMKMMTGAKGKKMMKGFGGQNMPF